VVSAAALRRLPGADGVPFLAPLDLDNATAGEHAAQPWTVRVHFDDTVAVEQTRGQMTAHHS